MGEAKIQDLKSFKRESRGICSVKVDSIKDLNFVISELASFPNYVWRGQKSLKWTLEPTLSRIIDTTQKLNTLKSKFKVHLENFQYASRGRRGINPKELNEDEWWALAQHHGLATPLLDWSKSPYVSCFFAFNEPWIDSEKEEYRVLYALNTRRLQDVIKEATENGSGDNIAFIKPLTDDNARLVSQNGLFTKGPISTDIQSWINNNEKYILENPISHNIPVILFKIIISESLREDLLRLLNRMNINHLTLFPDLEGASLYANMCLKIRKYH